MNLAPFFFADALGENLIYRIFHDREAMKQLGDVALNKKQICHYCNEFEVILIPADWFVMLDKLYLRLSTKNTYKNIVSKLSKIHIYLDRKVPASSRIVLFLPDAVMTTIVKTS